MRKTFQLVLSLMAMLLVPLTMAAQVEHAYIDTENVFTATDATAINGGTTLCSTSTITMSQAWDDTYKKVNLCVESDLLNTVVIDGVEYAMPAGIQAQSNPNPNNLTAGGQTSGAVFKFHVTTDGILYVFCKTAYNKNIYVWEGDVANGAGMPVAYTFAGGQLKAGQGDATVKYVLPGDEMNYYEMGSGYDDGTKYLNAAQCVEIANGGESSSLTHWTSGNVLGVIAFPVYRDGEDYYVCTCGSKLISNGFIFVPGAEHVGQIGFKKEETSHEHNLTPTAELAATATTAGHLAYWQCTGADGCLKYFADAAGTQEIAILSDWLEEGGAGYLAPTSSTRDVIAKINFGTQTVPAIMEVSGDNKTVTGVKGTMVFNENNSSSTFEMGYNGTDSLGMLRIGSGNATVDLSAIDRDKHNKITISFDMYYGNLPSKNTGFYVLSGEDILGGFDYSPYNLTTKCNTYGIDVAHIQDHISSVGSASASNADIAASSNKTHFDIVMDYARGIQYAVINNAQKGLYTPDTVALDVTKLPTLFKLTSDYQTAIRRSWFDNLLVVGEYINHTHTLTLVQDTIPATEETTGTLAYWECTGTEEDPGCHLYFANAEGTDTIGNAEALAEWLEGEGKLPIAYDDNAMYFVIKYYTAQNTIEKIINTSLIRELSNTTETEGEKQVNYFDVIFRDPARETLRINSIHLSEVVSKSGAELNTPAPVDAPSRKAANTPRPTIDLTFDNSQKPYHASDAYGNWDFRWTDATGNYSFHLEYPYTTAMRYGHITLDGLHADLSYLTDNTSGEPVNLAFTAVDVTITNLSIGFTFYGYVTCVNGITYNIDGIYLNNIPNALCVDFKDTEVEPLQIMYTAQPHFVLSEDGMGMAAYCATTRVDSFGLAGMAKLSSITMKHHHTLTLVQDTVFSTDEEHGTYAYWECTGAITDPGCHQYFADSLGRKLIGDADELAEWLTEGKGVMPLLFEADKMYVVVNDTLVVRTDRIIEIKNDNRGEEEDYFVMTYTLLGEQKTFEAAAADMTSVVFKTGDRVTNNYIWEYRGVGSFTESVLYSLYSDDPITIDVEVYEDRDYKGIYMFKGHALQVAADFYLTNTETMAEYEDDYWFDAEIVINATDSNNVIWPKQYYGMYDRYNLGWFEAQSVLPGKLNENGEITWTDERSFYIYAGNGNVYYGNQDGATKLVLPSQNGPLSPRRVAGKKAAKTQELIVPVEKTFHGTPIK